MERGAPCLFTGASLPVWVHPRRTAQAPVGGRVQPGRESAQAPRAQVGAGRKCLLQGGTKLGRRGRWLPRRGRVHKGPEVGPAWGAGARPVTGEHRASPGPGRWCRGAGHPSPLARALSGWGGGVPVHPWSGTRVAPRWPGPPAGLRGAPAVEGLGARRQLWTQR